MTLHEIEKHVAELPSKGLAEFAEWFDKFKNDRWDDQIEGDVLGGRLDQLKKETRDEHAAELL